MSIAFQALVLVALSLPGIIFRRFANRAGQFRQRRPITEDVTRSIVSAAILNAIWAGLWDSVGRSFGIRVDLNSVVMLSMGQFGHEDAHFMSAVESLTWHPWSVLSYFLSLYLLSMIFGHAAGIFAHQKPLKWIHDWIDEEPSYRRSKEWTSHLEYQGAGRAKRLCATVLSIGSTPYLYFGFLEDDGVMWKDDGHPDRFALRSASRKRIDGNGDHEEKVPGQLLIIRASEAKTLCIWWVELSNPEEIILPTTNGVPAVVPQPEND
ncbi:DUF6338 family protein [Planctomicrobium piriforme]|uniref:Uncharacterized protein n=1 Tax=Planctomicrobium piriforme TaxID=1576369 RepID=A0A1I3Q1H8_9PLAN|nr:DUF6338 family protein [Planctomicrobium piriforme]SFJ27482.1 hypothetical protein SAMN05421753_117106 [Planctomicrobium piriforme]